MPNLRHVTYAVLFKLHDIDVVRRDVLVGWRRWSALTAVSAIKDSVSGDVAPLLVGRERDKLIPSVRDRAQETFHPVAVLL